MVRKTNSNEDEFNIEEENDPTIDSILNKTKKELPSDKIDDSKITDTITDGSDSNDDVNIDDNGDVAYVDKNAAVKAKQANRQKKLVIIAIIALLLLTGVIGFIIYWNNAHNNIQVGNRYANTTNVSITDSKGGDDVATSVKKYMTDNIHKRDYYATSKNKMTEEQKKAADADAIASAPANSVSGMANAPHDTDDMTKVYNNDGSLNDDYTFIKGDTIVTTIRDDIERLINPVYGQWSGLQNSDWMDWANGPDKRKDASSEWANFRDMLSSDLRDTVSQGDVNTIRNVLPIYADWDKNQYNGEWKRQYTNPIVGKLQSYTCNYYIQSVYGDHINCTAEVTYYGLVNNEGPQDMMHPQSSVMKTINKTLKIEYIINYSDTASSDRRILIDNIQQN